MECYKTGHAALSKFLNRNYWFW